MAKIFYVDLDGTLTIESHTCHSDLAGTWTYRQPNQENIEIVRKAADQGWTIVIWTGRSEYYRGTTEDWLHEHKVPHHLLICGKNYFTMLWDDRAKSKQEIVDILNNERSNDPHPDL